MWTLAMAAALTVAPLAAGGADEDLAIVRRAVGGPARAAPAASAAPAAPDPQVRSRPDRPRWLKVRVVDKIEGRKKVTVNLPLALVRAVGDDWPVIRFRCPGRAVATERCSFALADVLEALEAGEELVEVEDEDAVVRVWVE